MPPPPSRFAGLRLNKENFGRVRVDSSSQFHVRFNSSVESFSKSCHAYLPARHEAVTLSHATTGQIATAPSSASENSSHGRSMLISRFAPEPARFLQRVIAYGTICHQTPEDLEIKTGEEIPRVKQIRDLSKKISFVDNLIPFCKASVLRSRSEQPDESDQL